MMKRDPIAFLKEDMTELRNNNLEWVIRIENGLLAMSSRKTTDRITIINKGDTEIITSSALIGFGEIKITIEVYINPLFKVEKQIDGFVFFPFIQLY